MSSTTCVDGKGLFAERAQCCQRDFVIMRRGICADAKPTNNLITFFDRLSTYNHD
ncbi:hypothetical protein ALP02_02592 [Pseudomonas coronafaciens pv. garcae]|nr:hypothetical protein ALP02_02592 [Pseudomonas coronafaciens pv. garcae]